MRTVHSPHPHDELVDSAGESWKADPVRDRFIEVNGVVEVLPYETRDMQEELGDGYTQSKGRQGHRAEVFKGLREVAVTRHTDFAAGCVNKYMRSIPFWPQQSPKCSWTYRLYAHPECHNATDSVLAAIHCSILRVVDQGGSQCSWERHRPSHNLRNSRSPSLRSSALCLRQSRRSPASRGNGNSIHLRLLGIVQQQQQR